MSSGKTSGRNASSFNAGFEACQKGGIGETSPKEDAGEMTVEDIVAHAITETQEELKWAVAWNSAPKAGW